ncbi:MAG: hypothetical protein JST00_28290 [Deltaproteobacteria bacterium]|nr:hypothetical protein [Deltaproteobacteria bacterium]
MGKCRPISGSRFQGALAAIAALGLVACAQLAGLDDESSPIAGAVDPATEISKTERANEPGAEKQADQNAEDLAVSKVDVEFGSVLCNTESKHSELVVTNLSETGRKFTVTIPPEAPFGIVGAEGNVFHGELWAKGTAKIELFAKPSSSGLSKSSAVVASNGAFITVPLGVNGTGAELEWGTELADVGETPLGMDGTVKVLLKNKGASAAVVRKFDFETAATPFSIMPASLTIQPGTEAELTVKLAKGGNVSGKLANKITPDAWGQCSAPPSVRIAGERVDTSVTVTGADFGRQPCHSSPAERRPVVIKNYYSKPVKWTLKRGASRYQLAYGQPTSGTVDAANGGAPAMAMLQFSAPPLGAALGTLEEEVTITIENTPGAQLPASALGDKTVKLRTDVRGAILRTNAPNGGFVFTADRGGSAQNELRITNEGNETAKINWEYARISGAPAWTGLPGTTMTYGGKTTTARIVYSPTGSASTARLTPVQNGGYRICNANELERIELVGRERSGSQSQGGGEGTND